jgi:hypothetical protein
MAPGVGPAAGSGRIDGAYHRPFRSEFRDDETLEDNLDFRFGALWYRVDHRG